MATMSAADLARVEAAAEAQQFGVGRVDGPETRRTPGGVVERRGAALEEGLDRGRAAWPAPGAAATASVKAAVMMHPARGPRGSRSASGSRTGSRHLEEGGEREDPWVGRLAVAVIPAAQWAVREEVPADVPLDGLGGRKT